MAAASGGFASARTMMPAGRRRPGATTAAAASGKGALTRDLESAEAIIAAVGSALGPTGERPSKGAQKGKKKGELSGNTIQAMFARVPSKHGSGGKRRGRVSGGKRYVAVATVDAGDASQSAAGGAAAHPILVDSDDDLEAFLCNLTPRSAALIDATIDTGSVPTSISSGLSAAATSLVPVAAAAPVTASRGSGTATPIAVDADEVDSVDLTAVAAAVAVATPTPSPVGSSVGDDGDTSPADGGSSVVVAGPPTGPPKRRRRRLLGGRRSRRARPGNDGATGLAWRSAAENSHGPSEGSSPGGGAAVPRRKGGRGQKRTAGQRREAPDGVENDAPITTSQVLAAAANRLVGGVVRPNPDETVKRQRLR